MKKKSSDASLPRPTDGDSSPAPHLAFPVVGVGASAGGLEAFTEFLDALPANPGMAIVFILHLPPEHKSLLPDILRSHTQMSVHQIADGMPVAPNAVYVIRPGFTVTLSSGVLHLGEPAEKRGHRHPVDDFFRSLAHEQKERAIAIVMSGMGTNGTLGTEAVRELGGMCIAQDPTTAKFPDMPDSLAKSGRADFVLTPKATAEVVLRYGAHPYVRGTPLAEAEPRGADGIREVLQILLAAGCPDFSGYKQPTLARRLERRMGLRQIRTIAEYVALLRNEPDEVLALADDLVINVTGFFRDPQVWSALREKVIVPLVTQRENGSPLRAWVSACSSGEESYTLGVLLLEAAREAGKSFDIKIFATDVANRRLMSAREGVFPAAIEDDVSQPRLERYFERIDSSYRARKELREIVVFAPHNLLQDPPFSRLDICTCRNLLIYLKPPVQQRVLGLMHFALAKEGVLLLGTSETVGSAEELFEPIDKKARIYRRLGRTRHDLVDFPVARSFGRLSGLPEKDPRGGAPLSVMQLMQQSLLLNYAPPSVIVDRAQRIIYYSGQTNRFVDQPHGEPTREILHLVRDPLHGPLRRALLDAMANNHPVRTLPEVLDFDGRRTAVACRVAPLEPRAFPDYFLVSFEESAARPAAKVRAGGRQSDEARSLEQELLRTREELQSKIGELQLNNEELKAANEESVSINEELQSTNEELETSKEELQSLNEEMTSVNAQLQSKMLELENTTNDLSSLLSSTNIAVIFLDNHFRIRRFTPAVRELVDLIPQDVGRPLSDLALKFTDENLTADARRVGENLEPIRREISSRLGRTYMRTVLPYRAARDRVDGIVVTFIDITDRQRAERALRESAEQNRLMLESLQDYAIFLLNAEGIVQTWPKAAERVFGYTRDEAIGQSLSLIFPPEIARENLAALEMQEARKKGSVWQEGWRLRKNRTRFWGSGVLSVVTDENGNARGFVKVLRDDTKRRNAEEDLRLAKQKAEAANEAKDQFLATVSHELRTPLSSILLWASLIGDDGDINPTQLREALGAIKRGVEEQRELIEDLVDTARIAAGKLSISRDSTDLVGIARAVLASLESTAHEKGLTLRSTLDPRVGRVSVDPIRMRQVISNLLSNAIKFTHAGGRIETEIRRAGDVVEIKVTDTGQGFTPEFQQHLFTRFEQASQESTRAHGGLGIGLSIVKQIVLLHGGQISGESPGPNQGATFTIRLALPVLPTHSFQSATAGKTGRIAAQLAGVRILLVEDSVETQRALTAVLLEAGAIVATVGTAPLALDRFEAERPDLIVSDVGLPEVNGYQFIARVRELERAHRSKPVPALALTAFAGEDTAKKAQANGFQQCLSKPVEPALLVNTLLELRASSAANE